MDLEIIRNHLNATVECTRDLVIVTTGTLSLTPFNLKAQCLQESFIGKKKWNRMKNNPSEKQCCCFPPGAAEHSLKSPTLIPPAWATRAVPVLQCHPSVTHSPLISTAGTPRAHRVQTGLGWDLSSEQNTNDSTHHVTRATPFPHVPGETGHSPGLQQ